MSEEVDKLVCEYYRCGWVGLRTEALSAPDPFNGGDMLYACPECRDQTLVTCCDEPGCRQPGSCGNPTDEGYRRTCLKHIPKSEKQKNCEKCNGDGWVWGYELDHASEDTANDLDTKYSCDRCSSLYDEEVRKEKENDN